MSRDAFFPGLVSVVRIVILWCSAFWLFTMTEYGEIYGVALGPFLLFGIVSFLILWFFLQQPRTLPALTTLGTGISLVGGGVLLWRYSTLPGIFGLLFGALAVITVVYGGVRACTEPPAAAGSIGALEGTTLFALVFLWVQTATDMEPIYSIPLLAASLLSLLVVLYQRLSTVGGSSGRGRGRGLLVVGGALIVIAVALVLFMLYGAAPLGQGAVMLYYGVVYCLKLLLALFKRLLMLLAALFPGEAGEMELDPPAAMEIPEEYSDGGELNTGLLIALGIAGLCLVAVCLIYLVYRLRRLKIGGGRTAVVQTRVSRRKLSLLAWLKRIGSAVKERWLLLAAIVTMRGSPQELFLFLTRAGRRLDCARETGETPCAFVRRMAGVTAGETSEELPAALERLAAALGKCLYSREEPESFPRETTRIIRKSFRRALRRARWGHLRDWLRQRFRPKPAADSRT